MALPYGEKSGGQRKGSKLVMMESRSEMRSMTTLLPGFDATLNLVPVGERAAAEAQPARKRHRVLVVYLLYKGVVVKEWDGAYC